MNKKITIKEENLEDKQIKNLLNKNNLYLDILKIPCLDNILEDKNNNFHLYVSYLENEIPIGYFICLMKENFLIVLDMDASKIGENNPILFGKNNEIKYYDKDIFQEMISYLKNNFSNKNILFDTSFQYNEIFNMINMFDKKIHYIDCIKTYLDLYKDTDIEKEF